MVMDNVAGSNWYNWAAYVLSVVASLLGALTLGFSGLKDDNNLLVVVAVPVAIGLVAMSVLNTPLTLLVRWKAAIHVFYAYHIGVHCFLIATLVIGLVESILRPFPGPSAEGLAILLSVIYAASLWGPTSRYRASIQRKRDTTLPDTVDPRGPRGK
jgi:hypothetical protein